MSVQLIIDGNSITDVIAQVNLLADATGIGTTVVATGQLSKEDVDKLCNAQPGEVVVTKDDTTETKPKVAPKKEKNLSTADQREAVKEMVAAGEKDDRYERLNNTNQKRVDDAIAKLGEETNSTPAPDVTNEPAPTEEPAGVEVTIDTIRAKMSELGQDENGNENRENLTAIRDVLVGFIPEGQDVMISNIPEDQMVEFYKKISELG